MGIGCWLPKQNRESVSGTAAALDLLQKADVSDGWYMDGVYLAWWRGSAASWHNVTKAVRAVHTVRRADGSELSGQEAACGRWTCGLKWAGLKSSHTSRWIMSAYYTQQRCLHVRSASEWALRSPHHKVYMVWQYVCYSAHDTSVNCRSSSDEFARRCCRWLVTWLRRLRRQTLLGLRWRSNRWRSASGRTSWQTQVLCTNCLRQTRANSTTTRTKSRWWGRRTEWLGTYYVW